MSEVNDGTDPRKAAYERLIEVEMQHPNSLMAMARLISWCKQTGVLGMGVWKVLMFFAAIFGAWIATKQWIFDVVGKASKQ
jgi:hypothetical protein